MNTRTLLIILLLLAAAVGWWVFATPSVPALTLPSSADAVERGEYLVAAGGCIVLLLGELLYSSVQFCIGGILPPRRNERFHCRPARMKEQTP